MKEHGKHGSYDMKEEIHDQNKKKNQYFSPTFLCYVSRTDYKKTYFTND